MKTKILGIRPREIAYTVVLDPQGKWRLGIAERNSPGYYPVKEESDAGGTFKNREEGQGIADDYNKRLGLTPLQAMEIVLSSLGG